ncbi:MAG: hypothetical protein Q8L48_42230 [Archangium sp.]|nr:hypothetical protein [Archangium sp.]
MRAYLPLSFLLLWVASPAAAQDADAGVPDAGDVSDAGPVTFVPPAPSQSATSTKSTNAAEDAQKIAIPQVLGVNIVLSGYFWGDTGYMARTNAQQGQYDQSVSYLQGRFVLGAGLTRTFGDFYASAKVEFLGLVNEFARSQYEPHTLDSYVRVGHKRWFDVQVGRFLAWEIYHRGQGIEFWTAEEAGALGGPSLYWLDLTRGYRNESGQGAIHFYPFEFLKFELAGVYGQENNQNNYGVRPAVHFTWKDLQFLAGYETLLLRPQTSADKVQTTTHGYAARLQYTFFKHATLGVNFAQTFVNSIDIQGLVDSDRSLDKYTVGGFADIDFWNGSIGLGYHHTNQLNLQGENNRHHQAFVSYLYRLPIQGLSLKAVYGFALAHIEDLDTRSTWENYVHSFRLRISYEFN